MNKNEFLDTLRQSLNGEVSSIIIEQNIKYYNQYISSSSPEEEDRILESLGDPRLIAKTIIEKERAASQKSRFNQTHEYNNTYYETDDERKTSPNFQNNSKGIFSSLTWMQKLTLILILLAVIIVIFFVGRLVIGFLVAFGVPILLILLLMALFKKR